MKIVLDSKEIPLRDSYAAIARHSVDSLLAVAQKGAESDESLYLTMLLVMYQRSAELLNELGADNIRYVLNNANQERN